MNKNYNNTRQCNQRKACDKCKKSFWLGQICQMEN
jgi:hypothetical protein